MKPKKSITEKYLTKEELDKLLSVNSGNTHINKVRDLFIFMCGTGMRFSSLPDIVKVEEGMVFYLDGKTARRAMKAPIILKEAEEVLIKFRKEYPLLKQLPIYSLQKFNFYLKELGKEAGIEKNIVSNMSRVTYAALLLNAGFSQQQAESYLGVTTGIQYFAQFNTGRLNKNSMAKKNTTKAPAFEQLNDISELKEGDYVKHALADDIHPFIVTGNYGDRATAVRTIDITNPSEWLVLKLDRKDK